MLTYLTSNNHYFPSTITLMELIAEMENRRQLQKVWIVLSHFHGQAPFLELWYFLSLPRSMFGKRQSGHLVCISMWPWFSFLETQDCPDRYFLGPWFILYKMWKGKKIKWFYQKPFFNWKISNQLKIQLNSIEFPEDYSNTEEENRHDQQK